MHKRITIWMFTGILTLFIAEQAITRSGTPPAGQTGAPSEANCIGSGCHSGTALTGNIDFTFGSDDTVYIPGQTYSILVDPANSSAEYGFEATALDATNSKAGDFVVTDAINTQIQNLGGRQYISHKNAGLNSSWSFDWTAPSTDVGDITFYVVVNNANGNGFASGDQLTKDAFVYPAGGAVGISEPTLQTDVWVSQVQERISIHSRSTLQGVARVFDVNGRVVLTENVSGTYAGLQLHNVRKGLYIVQVQTANDISTHKVIMY